MVHVIEITSFSENFNTENIYILHWNIMLIILYILCIHERIVFFSLIVILIEINIKCSVLHFMSNILQVK